MRLKQKFIYNRHKKSLIYTPNVSALESFCSEKSDGSAKKKEARKKAQNILSMVKSKCEKPAKSYIIKEEFILKAHESIESEPNLPPTEIHEVLPTKPAYTLKKDIFLNLSSDVIFRIFSFVYSDYSSIINGDKQISHRISHCLKDFFYPFVSQLDTIYRDIFQLNDYYFESKTREFRTNVIHNSLYVIRPAHS